MGHAAIRLHSVRFRNGDSIAVPDAQLTLLFWAVLGHVLAGDYHSDCRLTRWDAVREECDRELCFIAGQMFAQGSATGADALRTELCCWHDELYARSGPCPERATVGSLTRATCPHPIVSSRGPIDGFGPAGHRRPEAFILTPRTRAVRGMDGGTLIRPVHRHRGQRHANPDDDGRAGA